MHEILKLQNVILSSFGPKSLTPIKVHICGTFDH